MYQDNAQLRELYLDFIENFCFGEKPEPKTDQSNISKQISHQKYPIWPNRDALCWLNATMALLVHCNSLKKLYLVDKLPDCQIRKLFQDYYSLLEKVNSTSANTQDDENIYYALTEMQEQAFKFLAQKQGCKKGVNDSPIFAIPLLLKEKEEVLRIFKFNHKWRIQCEECQWQKTQQAAKVMLTFPKVSENFSFEQPVSLCSCLRCLAPDQKRLLIYERLPQSIILHFEQGAGQTKLDEYDFTFENNGYYLSCVVLYTGAGETSHFITWIRNIEDETWLNCDDLLENPRQFGKEAPNISGKEIHLMVLERSENKNGEEDDSPSISDSVDNIYSSSVSSEQTVITLDSDDSQDLTLIVDKDFEHTTQPSVAHKKQLVANNSSKLKSLDKIHQSSNCNSFLPVDSLVMKKQWPASLSNTTELGFLDVFSHTENLSSHSATVTNALTLSNKTSPKSSKCFHAVPLLLSKENVKDVPACVTTDGKHNTSYETNSELPMKRLTFHDDAAMVNRENLLVFQRPTRVRKRKILDDYLYPDDIKGNWNLLLKKVPLKRGNSQQTIKELTISKKKERVQNCQHITVMHRILKDKDKPFKSAKKINKFAKKNIVPAEKISELQLFRSCKTYSKKTPNIVLQSPQELIINVSSISNNASGLGKHVKKNAKVSKKVAKGKTCSLVTATHRISKTTNWYENNGFLKLSPSLKTYAKEKPKSPTHTPPKSTISGHSIADNKKIQPFLGVNLLMNGMVKGCRGSVFI